MKTKNTKTAKTTNNDGLPLAQAINEMFVARMAERSAKAKLLALMRADAKLSDDAVKAALVAGGYSEKSATNMTNAYRALVNGAAK